MLGSLHEGAQRRREAVNIAGDGQDTAVTDFVAVGGDQHIVDELGHTAHVC